MCGIYFSCAAAGGFDCPCDVSRQDKLACRGPDVQDELTIQLDGCGIVAYAYCSVLSLRGSTAVQQPLRDSNGSMLCWNGEAWKIGEERIQQSDTAAVLNLLTEASNANVVHTTKSGALLEANEDHVVRAMAKINGPFAFVFCDVQARRIYYGRDRLGRRSLLRKTHPDSLILSSVGNGSDHWVEVPADGINVLCMEQRTNSSHMNDLAHSPHTVSWQSLSAVPVLNRATPRSGADLRHDLSIESAVSELHGLLAHSVDFRVSSIPDRKSGGSVSAYNEADANDCRSTNGVKRRARLAVLFSGGLDCTILARLANDYVPEGEPLDLLNVAFENPYIHDLAKLKAAGQSPFGICPDRITARASADELRRVCPDRVFRLIEVDVPFQETQAHRSTVIGLMAPHNTEMDLSISLALYFAARGTGMLNGATFTTSARVLLSGLGADELFAGYQRHATAFKHRSWDGLLDELELDYNRLGQRNLGRDDRVISHWGKEARYPYLDEDLVKWAVEAPAWQKCGFGLPENHGLVSDMEPAKLVLRMLARDLGLQQASKERKRAIQFGARTAKMEGKTTGTSVIK